MHFETLIFGICGLLFVGGVAVTGTSTRMEDRCGDQRSEVGEEALNVWRKWFQIVLRVSWMKGFESWVVEREG